MTYLYNISTDDTWVIHQHCNFSSDGNTDKFWHSAGHIPLQFSYFSDSITGGFSVTQDAEEFAGGAFIIPWASTLIALDMQFEAVDNATQTEDIAVTVGLCAASGNASGTGPNITQSNAVTMTMTKNAATEGTGWAHAYQATTSVAFAADDCFQLYMSKPTHAGYSPDFACLLTMTFKRTG